MRRSVQSALGPYRPSSERSCGLVSSLPRPACTCGRLDHDHGWLSIKPRASLLDHVYRRAPRRAARGPGSSVWACQGERPLWPCRRDLLASLIEAGRGCLAFDYEVRRRQDHDSPGRSLPIFEKKRVYTRYEMRNAGQAMVISEKTLLKYAHGVFFEAEMNASFGRVPTSSLTWFATVTVGALAPWMMRYIKAATAPPINGPAV